MNEALPPLKLSGLDSTSRQSVVSEIRVLMQVYSGIHRPWRNGILMALDDLAHWSEYDAFLQKQMQLFSARLKSSGFPDLDWTYIKAILWVESGANTPDWNTNPMQIGVGNDPGILVVLNGLEKINLILPPPFRDGLTREKIISDPKLNIATGIAYLLNRLAISEIRSVPDSNHEAKTNVVRKGDTWALIAKETGTSVPHLKKLNPNLGSQLTEGQLILVQRVVIQRTITSWRPVNPANIAAAYNGGGDPQYAQKLSFVLDVLAIAQRHRLM